MQMNRLIPAVLALCWMVPLHLNAQQIQGTVLPIESYSGPEFDNFVATEGWIFVSDMTKGIDFPDMEGTPSVNGTAVFSAADFSADRFDPRLWAIEFNADPALPTNFRVGDKGVIQFHSAERCQGLYARHLQRKSKGQR